VTALQSEVEETIERIKVQHGVEGYVICNKQGQVLRRFPTMTQEVAEQYSEAMISLAGQARSVVRDLNPKVTLFYSILLVV
jgi:dynein light chain roadblock-type